MTPPSDTQSLRRLSGLLAPHRFAVAGALGCMAVASAGLLALPLLVRGMLEGAARETPPAWWQVTAMAAVLALLAVSAYISSVLLHEVARKACAHLRSAYVARWLRSSMEAHREVPAGQIAERLQTSLGDVDWFIKASLGNLLALVLVMTGGGVMLFRISWKLSLVILLVAPVVVVLLRLIEREGRRLLRLGRMEAEKMAGSLQGLVLGLDVVKACNAEEEALRRFGARQDSLLAVQRKESFVASLVEPLLIFAGAATFLVVVFLAGRLIAAGSMDLPEFITFLVYLMFVLPNLRNLGMQLARWRQVKVALEFLDDAERLPEEKDPGAGVMPRGPGGIEFCGVSYRHGGRESGLQGVSFAVRERQPCCPCCCASTNPKAAGFSSVARIPRGPRWPRCAVCSPMFPRKWCSSRAALRKISAWRDLRLPTRIWRRPAVRPMSGISSPACRRGYRHRWGTAD
jgi:ABC-type multidrug transport system fused ATPase/permease subunit